MKKIIVGLSGGVDSSVAAYLLLQEKKYIVEALFMRNWDSALNNDILGNKTLNDLVCPQESDYQDALKVAQTLQIKLARINFIEEYWKNVFAYFIEEYKNGRTPNPDVLCNKYIKFNEFLNYAIDKCHADYIAMGHYAQIRYNKTTSEYELLRAVDHKKDQTYFLCMLNQKQLSKTIFPVGNLLKNEVRKIAKENNLSTANKRDSTGICFIGERNFKEFLKNYIPNMPGSIVDIETNRILARHDGVMYYTIGQRRGLNLGGMAEKYFVVGKNISQKILYVANKGATKWLYANKCIVSNVNWINKIDLKKINCTASFRYRQKDIKVKIKQLNKSEYEVILEQKIRAIASGQFAVFYHNEICLGGGIITSTFNDKMKLEYYQ